MSSVSDGAATAVALGPAQMVVVTGCPVPRGGGFVRSGDSPPSPQHPILTPFSSPNWPFLGSAARHPEGGRASTPLQQFLGVAPRKEKDTELGEGPKKRGRLKAPNLEMLRVLAVA